MRHGSTAVTRQNEVSNERKKRTLAASMRLAAIYLIATERTTQGNEQQLKNNNMMNSISCHSSSYGNLDGSETHPSSTEAMEVDDDLEAAMFATAAAESIACNDDNVAASFGSDDFVRISNEDDAGVGISASPQPETHPHPAHTDHLVKSRQYYRDMVLGVNDGLVSTFLLVAGVVGGGMDVEATLLTSISGAIAGAISMFAGEYVATKSQN